MTTNYSLDKYLSDFYNYTLATPRFTHHIRSGILHVLQHNTVYTMVACNEDKHHGLRLDIAPTTTRGCAIHLLYYGLQSPYPPYIMSLQEALEYATSMPVFAALDYLEELGIDSTPLRKALP